MTCQPSLDTFDGQKTAKYIEFRLNLPGLLRLDACMFGYHAIEVFKQ